MKDKADKDPHVLNGLLYFGSNIKGTRQYFHKEIIKAVSLVRHIRIDSDEEDFCNLFLTFSSADLHWPELRRLLPESEHYLKKTVVKSMSDIPESSEQGEYITENMDYFLRHKAICDNADICKHFFKKRFKLLLHIILIKHLKMKDYIIRFEFQHRGSIHLHMIASIEGGPNAADSELAKEFKSVIDKGIGKMRKVYSPDCLKSRRKFIDLHQRT